MALRGDLQPIDVEAQLLSLLNQDRNYRPIQGPIGSMPARRESRQLEPSADAPFTPDWLSADPPSHAGDEPSGKSAPEGKAVRDDVALDEIELCGELIVAASAADDRLSLEAIDEVLGVAEERAALLKAHVARSVIRRLTRARRTRLSAQPDMLTAATRSRRFRQW